MVRDESSDRREAVYKIKCCDCQARLTEHKRVLSTIYKLLHYWFLTMMIYKLYRIDWDSVECVIYSTNYYTLPTLNEHHWSHANSYLQLTKDVSTTWVEQTNNRLNATANWTNDSPTEIALPMHGSIRTNHWQSQQPITSWLNWPMMATARV